MPDTLDLLLKSTSISLLNGNIGITMPKLVSKSRPLSYVIVNSIEVLDSVPVC